MSSEKNVVGIRFGVFGRGAISGDSGARILRQLTEIVEHINKEPPRFRIKLGVDQNFFKRQITALSKEINAKVHNIRVTSSTSVSASAPGSSSSTTDNEVNAYRELELLTKQRYKEEEKLLPEALRRWRRQGQERPAAGATAVGIDPVNRLTRAGKRRYLPRTPHGTNAWSLQPARRCPETDNHLPS